MFPLCAGTRPAGEVVMELIIPTLPPPSLEAQQAWARSHLDVGAPFRVDAWPARLAALAAPLVSFPLSAAERDALITLWGARWDGRADASDFQCERERIQALQFRLQHLVAFWERGAFVRLNTRSPKDNLEALDAQGKMTPVFNAGEALDRLLGSMERIHEDLHAAQLLGEEEAPVTIVVRPFEHFEPWREVRMFIENDQLVGISAYFYRDVSLPLRAHYRRWEPRLRAAAAAIQKLVPWSSFTLDGWMTQDGEFRFLEVNPPVSSGRTDPALFHDGRLDGSFRIPGLMA